jgi:hypothetical protein
MLASHEDVIFSLERRIALNQIREVEIDAGGMISAVGELGAQMDISQEEFEPFETLLELAVEQDRIMVNIPWDGSDLSERHPQGNEPQIKQQTDGKGSHKALNGETKKRFNFDEFWGIGPKAPSYPEVSEVGAVKSDEFEEKHSETGATVENFSTLSERLEKIEAEHIVHVNVDVLGARHTLVVALGQYRTSRFLLGEALAAYKKQFAASNDHSAGARGWMAAAKSVAEAMGRDERTVRNIIADYERIASLPGTMIQAAQTRGIDLAQRRYRPAVAAIESIIENDGRGQDAIDAKEADRIVSNVLVMPSPDQREQVQVDPFVPLTREEKQRFSVRMKIRTALTNIEPDQRLSAIIAALEEEMFAVWGQSDPVTVTIRPHPSGLTLDGRKRRQEVA